jgi:hypothetical protein
VAGGRLGTGVEEQGGDVSAPARTRPSAAVDGAGRRESAAGPVPSMQWILRDA